MAAPANTFTTISAIGNREDLVEEIFDVSPTETPFMANAKKANATGTKHEWQTDALAQAVDTNAQAEGDDALADVSTATTRLYNYTQISTKTASVSGTQDAVEKAGRKSELAYQMIKRGKELRRDQEKSLLANKALAATDPRNLGGIETWFTTNSSRGATGADPTTIGQAAATDGTQRAFTEALLKDVLKRCYDAGGNPNLIMVGPFNKQVFSGFTGRATGGAEEAAKDKKITAAVDVYASDFGDLRVVPNRFQRERSALVLDMEYWRVANLRALKTVELAKTGDSNRKQLVVEYTLEACNEASSGVIADLNTA